MQERQARLEKDAVESDMRRAQMVLLGQIDKGCTDHQLVILNAVTLHLSSKKIARIECGTETIMKFYVAAQRDASGLAMHLI